MNIDIKNKAELKSKFWSMMDQLRGFLSSDEYTRLLVDLYYLANKLPLSDLDEFISSEESETKLSILNKNIPRELPHTSIEDAWRKRLIADIEQIDAKVIKSIVSEILQGESSSPLIAESLMRLFDRNPNIPLAASPIELSMLALGLVKEDTSVNALCMGLVADVEALVAAQSLMTRYELMGAGVHRSLRQKIFATSGLEIDFPDLTAPMSLVESQKQYSCGLLHDVWGSKKTFTSGDSDKASSTSSEVSSLKAMLPRVKGKISCIVPSGFLFRTAGEDAKFKKHLLESGLIEAVIQLPERILSNTAVAPALLVINTQSKATKVQFIDASGEKFAKAESRSQNKLINIDVILDSYNSKTESEISTSKEVEELLQGELNLDVKRHLKTDEQRAVEKSISAFDKQITLGEIAEIISCQALKASDSEGIEITEFGPANLNTTGAVEREGQFKQYIAEPDLEKRIKSQTVQVDDIVFTVKGALGKCALIREEQSGMVANQSFCIIRLKDNAVFRSSTVLLRYLLSDLGKAMLTRLSSGATVKMIKMKDLQSLIVPVPSQEQQLLIEQGYDDVIEHAEQIKVLEGKIERTLSQY